MAKTHPLVLDAMIVTGNTKAAVKAAGGGSSDLWTVRPEKSITIRATTFARLIWTAFVTLPALSSPTDTTGRSH